MSRGFTLAVFIAGSSTPAVAFRPLRLPVISNQVSNTGRPLAGPALGRSELRYWPKASSARTASGASAPIWTGRYTGAWAGGWAAHWVSCQGNTTASANRGGGDPG